MAQSVEARFFDNYEAVLRYRLKSKYNLECRNISGGPPLAEDAVR
jgi:hypothetical protein